MVAAAIYGTRWEKIEKKKRTKQACSDSQYHTSFWFSTAASLVPVAAAFVWWLGSRREKEMKLKYASQVTCACPCGRRGPVGNRAPACQLTLARPIGFPRSISDVAPSQEATEFVARFTGWVIAPIWRWTHSERHQNWTESGCVTLLFAVSLLRHFVRPRLQNLVVCQHDTALKSY